jgi:hypothetical protein
VPNFEIDLTGTRLTLRLYDPNHPDDDNVTLSLDTARRRPTPVTCSHGGPVWCFFRTAYRFKAPPPRPGRRAPLSIPRPDPPRHPSGVPQTPPGPTGLGHGGDTLGW